MSVARRAKTKYQEVSVTVKMPASYRDVLDAWAAVNNTTRSGMVRSMIERQTEAVANATARATHRLSQRDTRVADALDAITEALNKDAMQVQKIGVNYNQQVRAARAAGTADSVDLAAVKKQFDEHNELFKKISEELALVARQ